MSNTNISLQVKKLEKLSGVARQQKFSAIENENKILYALAKFGWLTSHQIANLLWPERPSGHDLARRALTKLCKESFVNAEIMQRSSHRQIKAFYLRRKGMKRLKEIDSLYKFIRVQKTKRSITDPKYQYHRLISNQVLIDIRNNRLPIALEGSSYVLMNEHEMKPFRRLLNEHFGCIPDSLIKVDTTMIVVEVENSTRGPARHGSKLRQEGSKLEGWLPVYIERLRSQRQYSGHLMCWGNTGYYSDAIEIFVCTSEKIFRSIWRKMYKLLGQFNDLDNFIYYIVMNEELWIDPLRASNVKILEHNSSEARQLVAVGEERTKGYKKRESKTKK